MGRGSITEKMARLDQLLGRLKTGDGCTAGSLAEEFGISTRTLMRDLDTLKEQGYPVESAQGRGGGVGLNPHWGVGRLALNYREVIDLLLALCVIEKLPSPLLLGNVTSIRNKLLATLPDVHRPHIAQFRRRILVGDVASAWVNQSYSDKFKNTHAEVLLEAFFEKKCVTLGYTREDGEESLRTVEIHYLFLNWPVWYLVAWDHLRSAPRTFRLDRIHKVSRCEGVFTLKSLASFTKELADFSNPL